MFKKSVIVLTLACLTLPGTVPGVGHATKTYTIAYVAGKLEMRNVSRPGVINAGIGGYRFNGQTTKLKSVKVEDVTGNVGIEVTICVNTCRGNFDSFEQGYCTNAQGMVNLPAAPYFPVGEVVEIRVGVASLGVFVGEGDCPSLATAGTFTATFL